MIGVPLVGFLIVRWGWAAPFPVFFGVGLFILLGLWRTVPTTPIIAGPDQKLLTNFAAVLRHPPALASVIAGALISSSAELIQIVLGLWLEGGFQAEIAGLSIAALLIGGAELIGEGMVSTLTDRLGKKRSIMYGLLATSLAALLFLTTAGNFSAVLIVLFMYFLAFEFMVVTTIPIISEVMPKYRVTTIGLAMAFSYLGRTLGTLIGPQLFAQAGIGGNVLVAVLFNLLAIAAYTRVRLPGEGTPESVIQP